MKSFITILISCLFSCFLLAQPANDDCSGLIDLGVAPFCPDAIFFTNQDATESNIGNDNIPMNGACGNNDITFVGNDVWFSFTSSDTILDYTITVTGLSDGMGSIAMENPQIIIYRGEMCGVDELAILACGAANDGASILELDILGLDPNTVYYLRINDWSSTANPNWGTFQLCVEARDISVEIGASADSICFGESVELLAENLENFDSFVWTADNDPTFPQTIAAPTVAPFQTTTYQLSAFQEGDNLISNGDFEMGNTGFTTDYIYGPDSMPVGQYGVLSFEGAYDISNNPSQSHSNFANCPDNTTGNGNMMVINGAAEQNINIWCQTVSILPNTDYSFSTWATSMTFSNPAVLQFSINGVLLGNPFNIPFGTCDWNEFSATWNSGINTTAEICIVNQNNAPDGNDFALDDIAFHTIETVMDSITIYVSNPTINITEQINASCAGICDGSISVQVDGSISNVPISYLWSNGMNSANISNLCGGNYTLTITDGLGCTAETSVFIDQTQQFTASAISLVTPCEINTTGSAQVITDMGTAPFTYSWDNGEMTEIAENLGEGIHLVTVTDANGCSVVTEVEIILNTEVLDIQISSDLDTICSGSSVTLSAVDVPAGVDLEWNNGQSSESIEVNPVTTTTYTLTTSELGVNLITNGDFEDGAGVINSDYTVGNGGPWGPVSDAGTYLVTTNTNIAHTNFNSCFDHTSGVGNMMVVNGSDIPNINVWCQTVTIAPDTDYQFSTWVLTAIAENPAILQFSINGVLLGNPFQAPDIACNWQEFFEVWNSGSSTTAEICIVNQNTLNAGNDFALDDITLTPICTNTSEKTIVVSNLEASIINQIDISCSGTLGSAVVNVQNGIAPYTYNWSNGETTAIATELMAGTFQVTIQDAINCEFVLDGTIDDESITIDTLLIEGLRCGEVGNDFIEILNGSVRVINSNGTIPFSYSLNNGVDIQSDNVLEIIDAGTYEVWVEDANGCTATQSFTIEDITFPAAPAIDISTSSFCDGVTEIQLSVLDAGLYDRLDWSTGESDASITVDQAGTYVATVFNDDNCPSSASVELLDCGTYAIPNAFTPNGDGVSDEFGIITMGEVEVLEFEIFNRWGAIVHNDPIPWNGEYQGRPHPSDVLLFKMLIKTPEGEVLETGNITLIR